MSLKNMLALKWTAYALCAMALLFLRSLLLGSLSIWGVQPFLPPLLLACVASLEDTRSATIFGLCFGVCCDLLLSAPFPCLYTLAFTVAALLSSLLARGVMQESLLRAFAGTLLTFVLTDLLNMLSLALGARAPLSAMLFLSVREMLVSCLLLPVCYPVFLLIRRTFTL